MFEFPNQQFVVNQSYVFISQNRSFLFCKIRSLNVNRHLKHVFVLLDNQLTAIQRRQLQKLPSPRHAILQPLLWLVATEQSQLWLGWCNSKHQRSSPPGKKSMAAPKMSMGKPTADRLPCNTTSFQKKSRSKLVSIPGTRPSIQNGQLIVSTGVTSLDYVIGQSATNVLTAS